MLRSGGAKGSLLESTVPDARFRAINISSERPRRRERPEGGKAAKQPEGFNRVNLIKASGVAVTINNRYKWSTCTCLHPVSTVGTYSEAEMRQPGTCSSPQECNSSYFIAGPLPKQNAKNGSIKMTARRLTRRGVTI